MSLLPFMPWIIFSILVQYVPLWAASLLSFALLLLINRRNLAGRRLKLLDSAGIAFFLGMVLASLLPGDGSRISHWAAVLGNVTFTGVILASILLGKPFVLQYACDRAGPESAEFAAISSNVPAAELGLVRRHGGCDGRGRRRMPVAGDADLAALGHPDDNVYRSRGLHQLVSGSCPPDRDRQLVAAAPPIAPTSPPRKPPGWQTPPETLQ